MFDFTQFYCSLIFGKNYFKPPVLWHIEPGLRSKILEEEYTKLFLYSLKWISVFMFTSILLCIALIFSFFI